LLYTSNKTSNAGTKLFLDSSFYGVGAKLSDMCNIGSGAIGMAMSNIGADGRQPFTA
jgi:hypothetical protein